MLKRKILDIKLQVNTKENKTEEIEAGIKEFYYSNTIFVQF